MCRALDQSFWRRLAGRLAKDFVTKFKDRFGGKTASLQDMVDVRGTSVFMTACACSIGRAHAEILAEQGARVCIFDVDRVGLEALTAAMSAVGAVVWGQLVDVTDRAWMTAAYV